MFPLRTRAHTPRPSGPRRRPRRPQPPSPGVRSHRETSACLCFDRRRRRHHHCRRRGATAGARVPQYSGKRLVLCIIRIFIILCINTKNTSELLQVRARGTREGGGMVPASKYVMQGQLLGAINKESLFVFVDKLIPTSLLALVCCVCVSIQSATPCIISIQSAIPYFYCGTLAGVPLWWVQ